jgi:nicotinate-nucleotide pyrophosphorylase (carboxylating)
MTPTDIDRVRPLLESALREDIGGGDLTSDAVIPALARARGDYVTREDIVVCGLPLGHEIARLIDPDLSFRMIVADRDRVSAGGVLARVEGNARSILASERTTLNFLQRLCGIATAAGAYVGCLEGSPTQLLDTRKTVPGHRWLDKYAVRCGGGVNHRAGLYDAVLIKNNHIAFCRGPGEAVRRARERLGREIMIEVEVRSLPELEEALASGAGRILIDNFDARDAAEAVRLAGGRVPLEASGGITLKTVRAFADAGVDYVSVGALTHSVRAADIHLTVNPL